MDNQIGPCSRYLLHTAEAHLTEEDEKVRREAALQAQLIQEAARRAALSEEQWALWNPRISEMRTFKDQREPTRKMAIEIDWKFGTQ